MSREAATCKADYYERVDDHARSIVQHTAEMPGTAVVYDAANELADSSVIYSTDCDEILRFTNNRDAAFDAMGPDCIAGKESTSEVNTVLAYFAYLQDLNEALHGIDEDEAHELAGHHQCTYTWGSENEPQSCDEWHEDAEDAEDCCKTEFVCRDPEDESEGCGHEWKAYDEFLDINRCPECESTKVDYL